MDPLEHHGYAFPHRPLYDCLAGDHQQFGLAAIPCYHDVLLFTLPVGFGQRLPGIE